MKLFLADDCPSKIGAQVPDCLQKKTLGILQHSNHIESDDLPPGFEGSHYLNLLEEELSCNPMIEWKCPSKVSILLFILFLFNWIVYGVLMPWYCEGKHYVSKPLVCRSVKWIKLLNPMVCFVSLKTVCYEFQLARCSWWRKSRIRGSKTERDESAWSSLSTSFCHSSLVKFPTLVNQWANSLSYFNWTSPVLFHIAPLFLWT